MCVLGKSVCIERGWGTRVGCEDVRGPRSMPNNIPVGSPIGVKQCDNRVKRIV